MRKSLILLAAVAALGFSVPSARAADDTKKMEMNGVLIDNHCGEDMAGKDDAQKSAEGHKKACCIKCAKDGGMALMSDGKLMKLDKASSDKALEYLGEKGHGTKVMVEASKNDDGTLALADIKPAKKAEKKAEGATEEKKEEKKD